MSISLLLILLFILLLVGVFYQLVKIGEYVNILRKGDTNDYEALDKDSQTQAGLFVGFMIALATFIIWIHSKYSVYLLPEAGSAHGATYDQLMNVTMAIIWIVFVGTHIVLTTFIWKYKYNKNRRAVFYAHNNKLELLWTIVPAITLTGLVVYGLTVWNDVMYPKTDNAFVIELYAQQFKWTGRFAGKDGLLGDHNYRLTDDVSNPLAIDLSKNKNGEDDILATDTIYLPKNRNVLFYFRSRDVIHSAYMPHFRAQMNCVPGHITQFGFKPIYTTEEMRAKTGNPNFNYMVLCNKICGSAHYSMPMVIVVTDNKQTLDWWYGKKTYKASITPQEVTPVATTTVVDTTTKQL